MLIRYLLAGCLLGVYVCCLSCSSSTTAPLQSPEPIPTVTDVPPVAGLPGLDTLDVPGHELSQTGPGWFSVPPELTLASAGSTGPHAPGLLPLDAAGAPAFACYGVYGFDGDNGPTSARITVTDISGDYYVAFSDYVAGHWLYSGPYTGNATAEIPNPGNYISPSAFTSENGHCYLAVIVPDGGSLALTKVEMGVHGGTLGPAPPDVTSITSNADGIQFIWGPSPDAGDPDFAGYLLERAPQFHGEFTRLTAEPITDNHYLDYFAQLGTPYRYRLSAVDVSGNTGMGYLHYYSIDPGDQMNPVPVVSVPQGPLYGAQLVTFDLSASFDPEGGVIDNYRIDIWDLPTVYDGSDPISTTPLQPGCYIYSVTVTVTGDGRSGTTKGSLKVYPTWNDAPVVINPSSPDSSRGLFLSTGRQPATGRLVHAVTDPYTEQVILLAETPDGDLDYEPLWFTNSANVVQSPIAYNEQLLFLVESSLNLQLVTFDGYQAENIYGTTKYEQSVAGLATDGTDRIWLAVCNLDGAQYDLMVIHAGVHSDIHNAVENTGDLVWIDAEYNAATDSLDLVYTVAGSDAMYWARYGLDGTPVAGTEITPGDTCLTPMLEVNPATGRPALVYISSLTERVYYTELNADLTTWTVPELICDTMANVALPGLAFDDSTPLALIALNDGTYNVFRRDGTWNLTNTLGDSGTMIAIGTVAEASGPGAVVTYRTTTAGLVSVAVAPDGTNTPRWDTPRFGPQGAELQGACGSDGLHVVYRNSVGGVNHFTSSDGIGWATATGLPSGQNIDIVAAQTGDVYLSYYNAGAAYLEWWDGAGWSPESTFVTDSLHLPILSSMHSDNRVQFGGYRPGTSDFTFRRIQHGSPPAVTDRPFTDDVWAGCVSTHSPAMLLMMGGAQPTTSHASYGKWSNSTTDIAYYGGASQIMTPNVFVTGKTIAQAHYHTGYMFGDQDAFWTVSGMNGDPVRNEYGGLGDWETTPIDLGYDDDPNDYRRTVTAITTPGWTAVALITPLDNQQPYFEWSNLGDWETLSLPPVIEHMQNPELIVDLDGRWHLVYRDWVTDDLMCISTR